MYICICKGVTERQLLTAIDNGARTMRELRQQCNVCNCCGKCAPDVKQMLAEQVTEDVPATAAQPVIWKPALA